MKNKRRNSIILAVGLALVIMFPSAIAVGHANNFLTGNDDVLLDCCCNESVVSAETRFVVDICVFVDQPGSPAVGEEISIYLNGTYYKTLLPTYLNDWEHVCGKVLFNTTRTGSFTWVARGGQESGDIGHFDGSVMRFDTVPIILSDNGGPIDGGPGDDGPGGGDPGDGGPGDDDPGEDNGECPAYCSCLLCAEDDNIITECPPYCVCYLCNEDNGETEECPPYCLCYLCNESDNETGECPPDCGCESCDDNTIKVVNRGALVAAIVAAEVRVQASYTEESWAPFAKALGEARAVNENVSASQAQIDNAFVTLQTTMDQLVPIQSRAPQTGNEAVVTLYLYMLLASGSMITMIGVEYFKKYRLQGIAKS